jgi:putative hydrolases of HD superfamily
LIKNLLDYNNDADNTVMNKLDKQIQFIREIDKLKSISRRSYILTKTRKENSAEHSWHIL